MTPQNWKKHHRKLVNKIREGYDPELEDCFKDAEDIDRIHELIVTYSTGTLEEMSKKLGMKMKRVMRLIVFMLDSLHLPIEYDSIRKTYYYKGLEDVMEAIMLDRINKLMNL